ncbi:chaperone protein dnaJ 72-like isoform X2 [Nymphaea colorata]|uniref:chaperone protein dnaJ 72-like isoform X2 n=1 Tax=Nymphaea colorata TaxID=210225 RepID=UPI00129E30BE|nr:chaperone protein dnaJ 72-like isoform X2 [Nymphaea colorata]
MDYYEILGLRRSATKEEIKEAFRTLALKLHPDRHSQSPREVKETATHRFKQVSEAYDVLVDDRKRADYNLRSGNPFYAGGGSYGRSGYGATYRKEYRPRTWRGCGDNPLFDLDFLVRFVRRRGFLLNVAFASVLLGGAVIVERSGEALWRINNSGEQYFRP